MQTVLIANRGEVAVRVARATAELRIRTVMVYSEDDERSLHVRKGDVALPLRGRGATAYLDIKQLLDAARLSGCDAVHPGYGFLSENAHFASRCAEEGLTFVGPQPEVLQLFGDKARARLLAKQEGVAVIPGTTHATSLEEARAFLESLGVGGAVMIKALAGGGGRGMRAVYRPEDLAEAYARCASEARAAFGADGLYVEQLIRHARHIEVQIVGDRLGEVIDLGERECTLQRRHQKLVEVAPSPSLTPHQRRHIITAALQLARAAQYHNLGTFEFLLDAGREQDDAPLYFMEANPRLQVEHTVTEQVRGVDLVKTQLLLAAGSSLAEIGMQAGGTVTGCSVQARINMETLDSAANAHPSAGTLTAFEPPTGPGVRVDTFAYSSYTPSQRFDSLLAKVIASVPSGGYAEALARAYQALCEFRIEGIQTNIPFLQNLLSHPDVVANRVDTHFVEEHMPELLAPSEAHRRLYFSHAHVEGESPSAAVSFDYPEGSVPLPAPHQGAVVSIDVQAGDRVANGQQVAVLEAMKMEFIVEAITGGVVREIAVAPGTSVAAGQPLLFLEPAEVADMTQGQSSAPDLDTIRPDLREARARHEVGLDDARPAAVERRRRSEQRTARENIADLCDPESFLEYGALALAGQRRRRSQEELIAISPADGLVAGVGSINGAIFPEARARCMALAYDYTVFAGTQGVMNHKK
ncbi:MAG TPA: biotin carboxylase N-terminal domain-containing protein, partial [Ktedonobacteraceae bacterium]|nr:biotin carboxylase N-terminal domain-containing protein [Ktedonobacteraceae bacterium]